MIDDTIMNAYIEFIIAAALTFVVCFIIFGRLGARRGNR